MRQIITLAVAVLLTSLAARADDNATIAKVKSTWRAQDGETAEQIFAKVSKVAHFVPRGWEVDKTGGGQEAVTFSWARHSNDKSGDEYTIFWELAADGTMTLDPPYAKPMELGWQPFALSLIGAEATEGGEKPNLGFLHDLSNFNFVVTAQGKLGDLLKLGRCAITNDPVAVDYVPKLDEQKPKSGDFWHLQMQVNCDIAGPRYFTRGGVVLFDKRPKEDWHPSSFFAHRIATNAPGHWFDHADAREQETFDAARKAFERNGLPTEGVQSPFPK
ncbi:nodulate formation efficiency C protein [Bradyrhizobium sp. AZCC 2230]|uniref:nodulate formation efficiency C protein n=1 Tax=Bradyrhizobium sp. AZCC 2230 TaxID=3117021 RepID=UPI002FEFD130